MTPAALYILGVFDSVIESYYSGKSPSYCGGGSRGGIRSHMNLDYIVFIIAQTLLLDFFSFYIFFCTHICFMHFNHHFKLFTMILYSLYACILFSLLALHLFYTIGIRHACLCTYMDIYLSSISV